MLIMIRIGTILLSDRLFVGVGIFFFSVFQRRIDMGFDSPEHQGFFTEILECRVVSIVLLSQFCISGLDCLAVVFSIGIILGEQPVGSIELVQFCFVLGFIFLLGFREFDTENEDEVYCSAECEQKDK